MISTADPRADLSGRLMAQVTGRIDAGREAFDIEWGAGSPADRDWMWRDRRDQALRRARGRIETWVRHVPPMYARADLAMLGDSQEPAALRGFLNSEARNLFLAGPVGTGKTYAAWALAHQATADGARVAIWSTPRLLLDMRPDGDPGAFDRACRVDLLVLDDLGAARPTEWATEQLFCIADERTSNLRRTVITTNADFEELVDIWGDPTMDRLRDGATELVLDGASLRESA